MTARVIGAAVLLCAASLAPAGVASKIFVLKRDVRLRTNVDHDTGLRIESVQFGTVRLVRAQRTAAEVVVSSTRAEPIEAGVALALFDPDGNLVGAASAGPAVVRAGQSRAFRIVFEGVDSAAATATSFQVSLEAP